ncbi:MAG: hypothetical protein WCA46_20430 [Actinocatenispora sp.]
MFSPHLLRFGFRWAVLICLGSGALALAAPGGTPQFVISVFMFVAGLCFTALLIVLSRIPGR